MRKFMLLFLILNFFYVSAYGNKLETITLPQAVSLGLNRNLDLIKKRLEIKFKRMSANETFRAFLPKVGLSFNRAVTVRVHEQDSRQYRYEMTLDQLVFDGGKVNNTHKLAMADWSIAKRILQTQERAVRLQILTSFAKVLGGRKTVKLYKDFLKASKKELNIANLEVRLGTTTLLDKEEIDTRYESAKLELLKSKEDAQNSVIAFRKLLRIPLKVNFNLVGKLDDGFKILDLNISEKRLYKYAKNMRLDFINSTLQYQRAMFEYNSIKRSWLPDISLSGKFFLSGQSFNPTEKGYSVFLKFTFPFFGSPVSGSSSISGGDDKTASSSYSISPFQDISYIRKLAQTKSQSFFARIAKQDLPEDVRREIKLAVVNLELTKKRFLIRERQLKILKKRIRILELKIRLGESKRLDLAKARIELYKALIGRMEQIIAYINTAFKLETTVGLMPGTLKLFKSKVFSFIK